MILKTNLLPLLDAESFEFDCMWSAIRLSQKTHMIPSFRQMKAHRVACVTILF